MPSTLVDILDVSTPTEDLDSDDEADLEIPDFDDSFSSEDESDIVITFTWTWNVALKNYMALFSHFSTVEVLYHFKNWSMLYIHIQILL